MRNNKGAAFAITLIALAVISILGAALLDASVSETKLAIREENRIKAYYLARAGADAVGAWIMDPDNDGSSLIGIAPDWTEYGDGRFKVSVSGNYKDLLVSSIGEVNGTNRSVSLKMEKLSVFESSIYAMTNINLDQPNTHIYGSVQHAPGGTVTGYSDNITGTISVADKFFPEPVFPNLDPHPSVSNWNVHDMSIMNNDPGEYDERKYDEISIGGNKTLSIALTGDMHIVADTMIVGNGTINVTGTGNLLIYVNDLDYKGDLNTFGTDVKVIFLVKNFGQVQMQTGSSRFDGFIYGPGANVTIKANYDMKGAIIANKVNLEAGGEVHCDSDTPDIFPEELGFSSMGYKKVQWSN